MKIKIGLGSKRAFSLIELMVVMADNFVMDKQRRTDDRVACKTEAAHAGELACFIDIFDQQWFAVFDDPVGNTTLA